MGPGDASCGQETWGHEAGHAGAHVCVPGGSWALQGYLQVHISPCMSENRDPLLCVNTPAWHACFSSLPQPGSLSRCSEPGLSGCQPVAGVWPGVRLPWGRVLLWGQLLLKELTEVRPAAKPGRWGPLEQMVFPPAGSPHSSLLGSPFSSPCPFWVSSYTSPLPSTLSLPFSLTTCGAELTALCGHLGTSLERSFSLLRMSQCSSTACLPFLPILLSQPLWSY